MKAIVLTGATSMVGIALVKQCIQNNIMVFALVRPNSNKLDLIPNSNLIKVLDCDLEELSIYKKFDVPKDCTFYHIGWCDNDKKGRGSCDKQLRNVRYTLDAVHLAQKLGCTLFIGIGSQEEYGLVSKPLTGLTPCCPITPTGIAKYAAGIFSRIESKNKNIEHIWVRLLSTYGVNDHDDRLIKTFIKKCKSNIVMELSCCSHIWDYLFEDDVGKALIKIGQKGHAGKVYPLGSGVSRPLKDYLEIIKNKINPNYEPEYGKKLYGEDSIRYLGADISELTADTGWKPKISFEKGIEEVIASLKEYS
jgi:nucleoside-diphosphate-sugar epimerase